MALLDRVHGGDPLAYDCIVALHHGDDLEGDHPIMGADGVAALLDLYGITGIALARLYVNTGRDPETVRALVWGVSEGIIPIYQLRDAAAGLPVDLEIERIRAEAGAASAS
jgi:hypothetical protein